MNPIAHGAPRRGKEAIELRDLLEFRFPVIAMRHVGG